MIRITPFHPNQAQEVSDLIYRNIREINSKDYDDTFINILLKDFTPQRLLEKCQDQSIFVAVENGVIVGTGALENKGTKSEPHFYCVAMFILPEQHGKGIGSLILQKVEQQARILGAKQLQLRAARGAPDFYRKAGYQTGEREEFDIFGNLFMEKRL
jgi:GNAT superfamily N-acetyltransferase